MLPTNHRVIPKLRISGAVLPLPDALMAWTRSALPCLRPFRRAVSVCIASHSRIIGEWRNGKGCGRNRLWYIEVLSRYCLTELELGTLLIQVSGVTDTAACSVGGFVVGGGDLLKFLVMENLRNTRQTKWLMKILWSQLRFDCHCYCKQVCCIQIREMHQSFCWLAYGSEDRGIEDRFRAGQGITFS